MPKVTLKELIDSDDELPDFENERSEELPAYKDDYRFYTNKMPSVYSSIDLGENLKCKEKNNENKCKTFNACEKKVPQKRILISVGYLLKRDMFIIKSIEKSTTVTTLHWLINFMKYKSISKIKPNSCLVLETNNCSYDWYRELMASVPEYNNIYL